MAWTAPRTWVTNEIATAALLNTHLRDNLKEVWKEVDRVAFTSAVSVTATTEGTANTVVTGTSRAYTIETVEIEFFSPKVTVGTGGQINLVFLRGATVLGVVNTQLANGEGVPVTARIRDTPTATTFSYVVKAYVNGGTGSVDGGLGGTGAVVPGFVRVMQKGG